MDIRMMASGAVYKVVEVGYLHPKGMIPAESLGAGEVGYLTASIKTVSDTRVGDTITGVENPAAEALPGYHQAQPMVFSGVYPADGSKYGDLRDALEKLKLNDASMSFTQENSIALGFGFRCGFWAFCTWRSFSSASSANITSTSSRRPRTSSIRSPRPTARSSTSIPRSTIPTRRNCRGAGAVCEGKPHRPARIRRRDHGSVPEPTRRIQGYAVPRPHAR